MNEKRRYEPFSTLETKLLANWYGSSIEALIREGKEKHGERATEEYLICLVSENVENMVKDDLGYLSEGFISEIVGDSFQRIQYHELVRYFQNE